MPGSPHEQVKKALDEAFRRTGVPRAEFEVTKWGKDKYGKSHPTEWKVLAGANKGAEVNIDDPTLVGSKNGPAIPHVGYQTPGKRDGAGGVRGHILVQEVPVSRKRVQDEKGREK
nr:MULTISPECIES: polymorphic toxin type 47 domain-containing protein [Pseudomonas]